MNVLVAGKTLTFSCCVDLDNVLMAGLDLLHRAALTDYEETEKDGQSSVHITLSITLYHTGLQLLRNKMTHFYL